MSPAATMTTTTILGTDEPTTLTVKVANIPPSATAADLLAFLESLLGQGTIFAIEIFTEHKNWKSRGHGRVQFDSPDVKNESLLLSHHRKLLFKGFYLVITSSFDDIIVRPVEERNRVGTDGGLVLMAGVMKRSDCFGTLESWDGVKLWVLPEKKRVEFFVGHEGECYKLVVQFGDVVETKGCFIDLDGKNVDEVEIGDVVETEGSCLDGGDKKVDAILLKLKHAPKVYKKISGPNVESRFPADRYHICKEDFDFVWVRTTDFSNSKSLGYLSSLCWEIEPGFSSLDIYTSLPYYSKDVMELTLEDQKEFDHNSSLVPLVPNDPVFRVAYEVLFQLNSLVHTQKLSIAAFDDDLFRILSGLDMDTALLILEKLHKLPSTCYEPKIFIKNQSSIITTQSGMSLSSGTSKRLTDSKVMSCHRVLVTPSKIFCLGPELESSNYIVNNFAAYASDFLRVTFVDEDWGRLSASAVSVSVKKGIFAKPYRTDIYRRILSVLRDGIIIGEKKFEFLAFSASQLRSNSVWMFASNDDVKAEGIREWMGCFNKIRSISKCAARMGQLFSSSVQTMEVHRRDVDIIPDIEVFTDGVKYCFSDGIGKISYTFARDIAKKKLGLPHIPSAFQIRYGGYKGVIAVDRKSFKKLALRDSMLKFESNNCMLNITKWSESQPCYLNREIITLLSTLGVEDSVFLAMQDVQLQALGKILTDTKAAVNVLESTGGGEMKRILTRMLEGYEPREEPYLLMMLLSHLECQLADLRGRCRVFVPKGRVLVGCLDETGTLEYGQVYARISMNKSELGCGNQRYFKRVDETTCVVKGKVVVTKNPCLHPGDVRVLEAVWDVKLQENDMVDCLVFPQKGDRPHPNECSGGDLDGDLYFISWDETLIPPRTVDPMDYTGRRPRIMNHEVTLEEIQRFFADYMISDTLGTISTAHLIHADREPEKALSPKCLELANLHSMAVDFAKTGAPAEMPNSLKAREFPDFLERTEKPSYISQGVLGKLYRATVQFIRQMEPTNADGLKISLECYDRDLVVDGYEAFIEIAEGHKEMYLEKMKGLLSYYGAECEVEILTGNLQRKSSYLQRDNRRFGEVKDRILVSVKDLMKEAKGWLGSSCNGEEEKRKLASAWYYVTYHPDYSHGSGNCLGFPWAVGDVLLDIKASRNRMLIEYRVE